MLTETFITKFKNNKKDFEFLNQMNRRTTFKVLRKDYVPKEGQINQNQLPEIQLDETEQLIDTSGGN